MTDSEKPKITLLYNAIVSKINNLISTHNNDNSAHSNKANLNHASTETTHGIGSSQNYGHVKAGGAPQTIGTTLSAGTDNGIYARADHIHTINYTNILNKPSTFTPSTHIHDDRYYTENEIDTKLGNKVDKVTGKGLSTNDYTTAEKNKLAGIETQANKTIVDDTLSSTSENPVQNKAIYTAFKKNVGFIDDNFNLYLGNTNQNGFDIVCPTNIIQTNDTMTIAGFSEQGSTLYFYETYFPLFSLTSNKLIIQNQQDITLSTTLKDLTDGSRIKDAKVYFYEVYTPTFIILSNKNVIQANQQSDITVKIKDADGNLVKNEEVYFYEVYTPTLKTNSNKNVIQTNQQADVTAKLQDTDGNLIPDTTVYFYQKT